MIIPEGTELPMGISRTEINNHPIFASTYLRIGETITIHWPNGRKIEIKCEFSWGFVVYAITELDWETPKWGN